MMKRTAMYQNRLAWISATMTALLLSSAICAQELPRGFFEAILVPLTTLEPIPGANGSVWSVRVRARNTSSTALNVRGGGICVIPTCVPQTWAPESTGVPYGGPATPPAGPWLFYVDRERSNDIVFSCSVVQTGVGGDADVVPVPVPRERDFRQGRVEIIDVHLPSTSRALLRVFGPEGRAEETTVEIVDSETGAILETMPLSLQAPAQNLTFPSWPATGSLMLPTSLMTNRYAEIRIRSERSGALLWALLSITDNTSNHVTVAYP